MCLYAAFNSLVGNPSKEYMWSTTAEVGVGLWGRKCIFTAIFISNPDHTSP